MRLFKILVSILLIPVLTIGCASSGSSMKYSYDEVANEHERLRKELESTELLSESDIYLMYAKLFRSISLGNENEANKFADLFKKITNNSVSLADDGKVFSLAADYHDIFSDLANGTADLGIQDITVSDVTDCAIVLEIPYLDQVRYNINMVKEGDEWYSENQLVRYNGELGCYVFQIVFCDTKPSDKFIEKFPPNQIHNLQMHQAEYKCKLQLKGTFTPEHGYVIYIGCDVPFKVSRQELITTNQPIGTIIVLMETK